MADTPILGVPFSSGDRLPNLNGKLNSLSDLSGYTVRLTLQRPSPSVVLVKNVVVSAGNFFSFTWAAGELVTGERQLAVLQLVDGAGLIQTLGRFLINVDSVPA